VGRSLAHSRVWPVRSLSEAASRAPACSWSAPDGRPPAAPRSREWTAKRARFAYAPGKTYTACSFTYRLIKHAGARRVLFLVDRANLGKQATGEFHQFVAPDTGRKFTEVYNVQHLKSNQLDDVCRVTVCTIQRLYAMLRGEELEDLGEKPGFELSADNRPKECRVLLKPRGAFEVSGSGVCVHATTTLQKLLDKERGRPLLCPS